jgi:DNA-binding CsgD family transcriptional regulator
MAAARRKRIERQKLSDLEKIVLVSIRDGKTIREIAEKIGKSRSRVQQIQCNALRKERRGAA